MSTAALISAYAARYSALGKDALHIVDGDAVPARVFIVRAGIVDTAHGLQEQAVVKVLRVEFPQAPTGYVKIDDEVWRLGEILGSADGTNRFQWAVLATRARRFSVEK